MNYLQKLLVVLGILAALCLAWVFLWSYSSEMSDDTTINIGEAPLATSVQISVASQTTVPADSLFTTESIATEIIPKQFLVSDEAQFTFAAMAQDCREVPADQEAMDSWLEDASFYEEHPDYIREMEALFLVCLGVVRDYNYFDTLVAQAEKGNIKALKRYLEIYPTEVFKVLNIPHTDRDSLIEARLNLEDTKMRLIEENILSGNEYVIVQATWEWAHWLGPSTQFDYLTLFYLLRDTTENEEYFQWANEQLTFLQGIPEMSNEAFDTAAQKASELALRIQQNKNLPSD